MSGKTVKILLLTSSLILLAVLTTTTKAQDSLYVSSIKWNFDGTMIAIGSANNISLGCSYAGNYNVQLVDGLTGQYLLTIEPQSCSIESLNFNEKGHSIIITSNGGQTEIWNLNTFQKELSSLVFNIILGAELSNNNVLLLTTYRNGIHITDPSNRESFNTSRRAADSLTNITTATWSPDDAMIAIGDENGQVHLWNIAANTIDGVFTQHTGAITSIDWNPTQNVIASADESGNLRIWDATSLQPVATSWTQMQPIQELAWRPDGLELAAVSTDGTTIFSIGDDTWTSAARYPGLATALDYSPFGGRLAVGGEVALGEAQSLQANNLPFEILVPIATAERFAEIAAFCNAPTSLTTAAENTSLKAQSEEMQSQTLLAQLDALPEDAIPPGCEADLRAIAQAMGSE